MTRSTSAVRGLLLQRLVDLVVARLKLGVALLKFLEQPGVLDGDDGLVRERLQQCDLRVGEGALFEAVKRDDANRLAISQQRHGHLRQVADVLLSVAAVRELRVHDREGVRDVDRSSFQHGAAGNARPAHRQPATRVYASLSDHLRYAGAIDGDSSNELAVTLLDQAGIRAAEPRPPARRRCPTRAAGSKATRR